MGFLERLLPDRTMEAAEIMSIESRTQAAETIQIQQTQIQEASSQLEILNRQVFLIARDSYRKRVVAYGVPSCTLVY